MARTDYGEATAAVFRRRVMSFPKLPQPEPGEVLLVCTCYEDGKALWGGLLDEIAGRREGDVLVVGGSGVRLRLIEDYGWDFLHGGNVPALVADDGPVPPVVVLADIPVVYGGDGPLLVDLAAIPGRGVRVPSARLGEILADLLGGALAFDHLVRNMDVCGMYQGTAVGRPSPRRRLRRSGPSRHCPPPLMYCWSVPSSTTRRAGAPCSTSWAGPTRRAGSAQTWTRTRSTWSTIR